MTWSTAVMLVIFMLTTLGRLERLEAMANLEPGRWSK